MGPSSFSGWRDVSVSDERPWSFFSNKLEGIPSLRNGPTLGHNLLNTYLYSMKIVGENEKINLGDLWTVIKFQPLGPVIFILPRPLLRITFLFNFII